MTIDEAWRSSELAAERGVNETYLRYLRTLLDRHPELTVSVPRNSIWTGRAPNGVIPANIVHPVYGRVAFSEEDEDLGTGFYVGSYVRESAPGLPFVISWAAPKAQLFFQGVGADNELAGRVVAVRSFLHHDLDLDGFSDDVELGVDPATVFSEARADPPVIPDAPRRARRPAAVIDTGERPAGPGDVDDSSTGSRSRSAQPAAAPPLERAADLVHRSIARPRTGTLHAVLATLQPEQYALVTRPDDGLLIVQGQPGTGKTIIATHRAAYLTHPSRDDPPPLGRVLVIGPTEVYRKHISQVLDELGAGGVVSHSVASLFSALAGIRVPAKPEHDDRLDTTYELGRVVDRAAAELRRQGLLRSVAPSDLRMLVNELTGDTPLQRHALLGRASPRELASWLRRVGPFSNAQDQLAALPFLASCAQAIARADQFDHVIVDEAQDIRPLEWRVILQLRRQGGGLSLFGDINQRRSDWSSATWQALVDEYELAPPASDLLVDVISTGFRSTRQILQFANQLLDRSQRVVHALRDGPAPRVLRVRGTEVLSTAVAEGRELAGRHPTGLVAVICLKPNAVGDRLRDKGWKRGGLQHSWVNDGQTIIPLHPTTARGIEFDGVVVVEPHDFPENLGRYGPLYTSLTRATTELVVVHSKGLPGGMRAPSDI